MESFQPFTGQVDTSKYIKKDANQDGKTDLFVQDAADNIICFLSTPGPDFDIKVLPRQSSIRMGSDITVKDIERKDINGFVVFCMIPKAEGEFTIEVDTLIYKFGTYIPMNNFATKCSYKTITFEKREPKIIDRLVINNSDGSMCLTSSSYSDECYNFFNLDDSIRTRVFSSKIDRDSLGYLYEILDYIAPNLLRHAYTKRGSSYPKVSLEITYNNGQKVNIEDHGEQGTYGLIAFYDYIENLRRNVKWEKISDK